MMAVAAISKMSKIEYMYTSTYQAVSGAGQKGIEELENEIIKLNNNEEVIPSTNRLPITVLRK